MENKNYRIGIIVTWFGMLPSYFKAWLKSAEYNNSIDFIIISDQEVNSESDNIIAYQSTLENEISKYQKILNRKINIRNAYKFCDCRLFFGLLYADELNKYDFWGYCDIDLVFGDIRKFITNDVLDRYERIYQYGHLCLYKNNYKMNHIYDLPGGIYSLKEIFECSAKTTPEEYFGANRICKINGIKCYNKIDFIDLKASLPKRLEEGHADKNTMHQIYIWREGKAYCVHSDNGKIYEDEVVYIHWQKKNPKIQEENKFDNVKEFVITADFILTNWQNPITEKWMDYVNPPMTEIEKRKARHRYFKNKMIVFCKSNISTKIIWLRQIIYRLIDS